MSGMREIDTLLQRATDSGAVPGVAAMATDGREIIYQGAFGRRSLADSTPMSLDTVFWIASMTKAITGTCLMQLVEQGRIGLDDDVGKTVPALASPRVLEGFDASGKPRLRPARGPITLRQLMTHSAGFAYEMWNKLTDAWTAQTGLARIETFRRPEDCMPLVFDPGTSWAYGIGLEWAGKLLEAVSGETLDAYMQQHVAKPLGMNSTGYELRPEIAARLAGMHQRHPDGKLEAIPFDPPQDPESFLGGGGLYSTVGDYVRFIDMILNEGALDGARILKPETVAMMRENHLGDVDVLPLEAAQPLMTNDADFFPGMQQKWGLSFLINTRDVPGRRRAGSLAWAGLRNTYYWIDPKTKIGGTIMTQMLPFADRTVLDLLEAFEREVYRL